MKIAVLCNHSLAFSSIESLMSNNLLVGLATPQIMHETTFRVQLIAESKGIPFATIDPNNVEKSLEAWLKKCKPDVVYVITFPYKIPSKLLKVPKFGFFNWHTGLLPSYRGPDPIFWQILNQEEYGGITVHQMDENFDTGPIASIEQIQILPEDTYGQHIQKLALAAKKSSDYLTNILVSDPNQLKLYNQDDSKAGYQARPDFFGLSIDWTKHTAAQIKALSRASNPVYGGAITFFRGVPLHLLQVSIGSMQTPPETKPGTIISSGLKEGIVVLCSDRKLLRLDVVYTEDGFFTGGKLASIFDITQGEEFLPPPNPQQQANN
ncbi:MAG: formyltransferase family protein [Candidatus Caenarcaniphilales bacterium]|nr:formyltransferase family protein [Candidatus Caenarcaniphilales bacterium]